MKYDRNRLTNDLQFMALDERGSFLLLFKWSAIRYINPMEDWFRIVTTLVIPSIRPGLGAQRAIGKIELLLKGQILK